MKNSTKTIAAVFAVFLVAALFIGAASASEYREVQPDTVAFVYEKITINGAADPLVIDGDIVLVGFKEAEWEGKLF